MKNTDIHGKQATYVSSRSVILGFWCFCTKLDQWCIFEENSMIDDKFELIGSDYKDTSKIPKDRDLFYHCLKCDDIIPSVPRESMGCCCRNIVIDKEY